VTWGYDWHLDVEPTLLAIAQRNGHAWQSGSLVYFDKPIADTHRRRRAGVAIQQIFRRIDRQAAPHAGGGRRGNRSRHG